MALSVQREKDLVLRIIYNELGRVSLKWFKIGIQLGIPHYKLKEFREDSDPLSAVIEYWLAGNVPEADVPISWKSIVAALKVYSVGEPGLAGDIYEKYCQQATAKFSAETEIKQKLTKAKQATDSSTPHANLEHQLMEKNIQIESTATDSSPPHANLEHQLMEKNIQIENMATDPNSVKARQLPVEDQLDPDVRMDLEVVLEENLDEIATQYADYVKCLCDMLKEKAVAPEDLRSYLLSLPAFSKAFKGQNSALLADQKAELAKKSTINEIFDFLTMKCASFLNYDIFRKITKAYSIGTEKEELKYCDHLKAYIHKHKISEFAKINPLLKSNDGIKELILKFDIENTCTLARVDELKKTVAKILKLKSSALHIIDIEDGCVIVTFLIPASVADTLFTPSTVFTLQQEGELRAASVLWLKSNGHTFNFEQRVHTETQGLKKLKEQLTCSICLGTYTDPKLLQCNHSYCQQCLIGLVQQDQQGQLSLPCPTCRHITPVPARGVAGLPSDFRINQLLEIVGDEWDVAALHQARLDKNILVASPEEAIILRPEETKKTNLAVLDSHCPEHEKEVSLYCHTCSESICLKCAMKDGKHQGHVCEELDETFEKCKEDISLSLADIERTLVQLDTCCSELSEQRVVIEADIHSTILPDVRKTELIGQLHQLTQTKLKSLAIQKDQIETIEVQLKKLFHFSSKEDKVHLTKNIQEVKRLTSALQADQLKPNSGTAMKFQT